MQSITRSSPKSLHQAFTNKFFKSHTYTIKAYKHAK